MVLLVETNGVVHTDIHLPFKFSFSEVGIRPGVEVRNPFRIEGLFAVAAVSFLPVASCLPTVFFGGHRAEPIRKQSIRKPKARQSWGIRMSSFVR